MRTCESSLFLAIAFVSGLLLVGMVGCQSADQNNPNEAGGNSAKKTVAVSIDFGNRRANKHFSVPCFEDSTVLSILDHAQTTGEITIDYQGKGEIAFVKSIDGIENEGANGDNWVYRVNGKLAGRGCGVFESKPGDEIVWTLGQYKPDDD